MKKKELKKLINVLKEIAIDQKTEIAQLIERVRQESEAKIKIQNQFKNKNQEISSLKLSVQNYVRRNNDLEIKLNSYKTQACN
jgi:predicted DNA-binding ribbon-helix-helix protein